MSTTDTTTVPRGYRFSDHVPYSIPEHLEELHGPTDGLVRVRPHIDTSQDPVYDLSDHDDLLALYSAVVRAGSEQDHQSLLDAPTLERLWPDLNRPRRCREQWADRFVALRRRGNRSLSL